MSVDVPDRSRIRKDRAGWGGGGRCVHFSRARRSGPAAQAGRRPARRYLLLPSWIDGGLIARSATPAELPRKGREPRPPHLGAAPPVPRRSPRRSLHSVVAEGRQAVGAERWQVAPRVAERSWAPARPVLKHGPRSLTGPRVKGPLETPRRNEGEGRFGRPRWDPLPGRTTAPPYPLRSVWRRQSGHARTRKMVNYARAG